MTADHGTHVGALRERLIQHLRAHEPAPQLERMLLTGDLRDWRTTTYPVPGLHPCWQTMYRTPEPWLRVGQHPAGRWSALSSLDTGSLPQ